MSKHIILFFALLLSSITLSAQQNFSVSGKVLDAQTKEIVVHAYIRISNQITVLSNHQGEFQFHHLPSGTFNLDVSHVAYLPEKISLDLTQDSVFNIYLTPRSVSLDEVNVEKTHYSNQSNTLKSTFRKESQGKHLADVLADLAGVNVLRTGTTIAKPMINGLFGNRIVLLNNGTRHESQQWGLDHAPEIDPFASGKISILKNAEALRYGADALGGLVLLEADKIETKKLVAGALNIGANTNGKSGHINTQLEGRKNHFSYRAGLTAMKSGSLSTPDYIIGNTGKNELNGHILLNYQKQKNEFSVYFSHFGTELGIFQGAHVSTKEDIFARIAYGKPLETYDFSYDIRAPKQKVAHQLAKLSYAYQIDESTRFETNYSVQQNHRREYDLRRVQSDDTPMADIVLTTQQAEAVYKTNNTQAGIFGSIQVNNNTAGTGTTPIIPNFDNHTFAVFSNHTIHYGRNHVDLGLRYDYKYFDAAGYRFAYDQLSDDGSVPQYLLKDQRHFNNFSAVAGNTFTISRQFIWKSNFSLAWRAPSASELYSDGIHHGTGTYEIGNINLQSEKGLKWVNTFTYQNSWLHWNADLFGQVIDNYIYSQPNPDSVRQTIRGTFPIFQSAQDDAIFYGIDIQTTAHINAHWDYELNFSSVRAKNTSKNSYLPYIPADRIQQAITYKYSLSENNHSYIKAKHQFQSRQSRYETASDFSPPPISYHTFDLIAYSNWKLSPTRSIGVSLIGENIFNKSYKDYLDRFRYFSHSVGRNFALKVNYTF